MNEGCRPLCQQQRGRLHLSGTLDSVCCLVPFEKTARDMMCGDPGNISILISDTTGEHFFVSVSWQPMGCTWRGSNASVNELMRAPQPLCFHTKYTCSLSQGEKIQALIRFWSCIKLVIRLRAEERIVTAKTVEIWCLEARLEVKAAEHLFPPGWFPTQASPSPRDGTPWLSCRAVSPDSKTNSKDEVGVI